MLNFYEVQLVAHTDFYHHLLDIAFTLRINLIILVKFGFFCEIGFDLTLRSTFALSQELLSLSEWEYN